MTARTHLIQHIRDHAIALNGYSTDYSPLLEMIDDARFVLIGGATHGTKEFYEHRAELTKQLIRYYGFSAVAVEADWPDSYRINRYVRGDDTIHNTQSALSGFMCFPSWIWRNETMVQFIDWLKGHNEKMLAPQEKIGFYGLDLYSLQASIEAVIGYLDKVDPHAAAQARHRYACFHHPSDKLQGYGLTGSCEQEAVQQLLQMHHHAREYLKRDGYIAAEDFFEAEQNARVTVHAEQYYRTMFQDHVASWNLRDRHMTETLSSLADHLSARRNENAKIVIWAHNAHVGDARAAEMGERGQWSLGQLVREQYGMRDTRLIGFSTYDGTVTAASEWDGLAERKAVLTASKESYEHLFHEIQIKNFLLLLRDNEDLRDHLNLSRLQRAIGVVYQPEHEGAGHYSFSRIADQFDAIIHLDSTTALKPLEAKAIWHKGEAFETYPAGI